MKTVHYFQLALATLGVGLPQLASSFPPTAAPYITAVAAVCVLVGATLGVVSKSALEDK